MGMLLYLAGKLSPKAYYRISSLRYKLPFVGRLFSMMGNSIRNRDGVIQNGVGKGLKFNTGDSIAGFLLGTQEPQVQSILQQIIKPGMVVFDLGANVGFLTLILARLAGPGGRVIAFEPLAKNAKQIEYNAAQNQFAHVMVRAEAIGKTDGEVVFRVSDFSTTGKLEAHQHGEPQGVAVNVPMRSLDSVIASGEAPAPDMIKMDIEGAEAECLRGAMQLLAGKRPVMLIEIHGSNADVDDLLKAARYQSLVLGSKQSLRESHWNSQILAFPAERPMPPEICDLVAAPVI